MEVENKFITIANHIEGEPSETDFQLKNTILSLTVGERSNDVIVKNLYLSMDPYQINRMKKYSPSHRAVTSIVLGQAIDAHGVGRVVCSGNSEFKKDDIVVGILGWEEYSIIKGGNMLRKIDPTEFPLSYHASILGTSGFTAYVGFFEICKPKAGEKVFVSTASGSVGNLVGQFAKLSGCYVVGCAGSKQKVDMLKDKLGFDDAFNYKEEFDLHSTLTRYFPDGIDIYFDNVGGEMLVAAIANMNNFGRIAACGATSDYIGKGRTEMFDMVQVIYKRITIQGFLILDHMHAFSDFMSFISDHLRHGRVHVLEDISQGLESIPSAFSGLFRGNNTGKKLVQVTEI